MNYFIPLCMAKALHLMFFLYFKHKINTSTASMQQNTQFYLMREIVVKLIVEPVEKNI